MSKAEQFVESLTQAWQDDLSSDVQDADRPSRDYVYASCRRRCLRRMCLDAMHGDRDRPTPDALERMRRGSERGESVAIRLAQVGRRSTPRFRVIEQERRFALKNRYGQDVIRGRIDGRMEIPEWSARPVFEVKSGRSFERARTIEDLDRGRWTRHAADQLLAYLLAEGEPWGLFVIETPGMPSFIPVELEPNLSRAEAFLSEAERVHEVAHDSAPLPDYIDDVTECRRCPHHGKTCDAPLDYGDGVVTVDDPEVLVDLETVTTLRADYQAYTTAWRRLSDRFRGINQAICGDYLLSGKWRARTSYDIPKAIKDQYRRVEEHGSFVLDVWRSNDTE